MWILDGIYGELADLPLSEFPIYNNKINESMHFFNI